MTLALPSEKNDATRSARLQRLTRAQRTAILKALADPKRFELLENIARAKCPLGCAAAHEALAISPATLSHHIKALVVVGLVTQVREATTLVCHANYEIMQGLVDFLVAECCADAESKDARTAA